MNKEASLVAYFLAKYNIEAYKSLGFNNMKECLNSFSKILNTPASSIRLRCNEFDVFYDHRKGFTKRNPYKSALNLKKEFDKLGFNDIKNKLLNYISSKDITVVILGYKRIVSFQEFLEELKFFKNNYSEAFHWTKELWKSNLNINIGKGDIILFRYGQYIYAKGLVKEYKKCDDKFYFNGTPAKCMVYFDDIELFDNNINVYKLLKLYNKSLGRDISNFIVDNLKDLEDNLIKSIDIKETELDEDDNGFQQEMHNSKPSKHSSDEDDEIISTAKGFAIKKNPSKSKRALELNNHKCAIDKNHNTFTTTSTLKSYMEGHHLIPCTIANSGKYNNKIDIVNNIVSLCPICHRKIHYAIWEEKKELIDKLFNLYELKLLEKGIKINIDELYQLYGKKN